MPSRYRDWLAQGLRDVKAARSMLDEGFYEWAAFQAHQAAEKGLKALLRFRHREYRGHRLVAMLEELAQQTHTPEAVFEAARELDLHHMGSRYPNHFAEGCLAQYDDRNIAQRCVEYAGRIMEFVQQSLGE
ncbi:HEPN domain-containing protein [Thermoflexus hugenholtzii]